ncbi:MAG: hypothetical protein PHH08_04540, partial [Candidatus ainarchaeum sp.]|nr:hypothetical protein [Candidatus ainarchaeum sp.]
WHNAFRTFSPIKQTNSGCGITRIKNEKKEKIEFSGIPLIAIHSTHEYRGKDFKNAVEVLESAGFLLHLHAGIALIEKRSEKVAVHGLGGVPEKMALLALQQWNPKPVEGAANILLLHQSIKEFLPFDDEMIASISLSDLPKGFDLIADGHLHWNCVEQLQNCKFLLTGSTIITQMKKLESENKKAVSIFDTETKEIAFLPLPVQRKMFYEKIKFENASQQQVLETAESKLSGFVSETGASKPLIRLKLTGSLAKGISNSDINLAGTEKKFSEKAILSISKEFDSESFKTKIAELREMQKNKKSISEIGLDLLEKNLEEAGFGKEINARQLLELLEKGENEKALALLEQHS